MKDCIIKRILLSVLFACSIVFAFAQDADSIHFVNHTFKKERVGKGVMLVSGQFADKDLFGSNQYISYIVIKNKKRKNGFAIEADPKILKTVPEFAAGVDAIAAINGNFFNVKEGGATDYVKQNGIDINQNVIGKNGQLSERQQAAVVLEKGKLKIVKGSRDSNWVHALAAPSVMVSGPLLVFNGANEPLDGSAFTKNRHPRSATGVTKNGRVLLLVADGRNMNAAGLSLPELAKVMRWLGCRDAINFDGGGSSTLWTRSRGVVNHPSDNKKWDHEGVRKVANILYFRR